MFSHKSKTLASFAIAASLSLFSTGCTAKPSPTASESASASPTVAIQYETAPLTGIVYVKGANPDLAAPAIMGKVDNSEAARPQNALNKADVVFEEMVEGGMTRFLAVWHSTLPEKFGPVRSVRPMDPDLAAPFGGIIAFSGGQRTFVDAMLKTDVYVADETNQVGKKTFSRVDDRQAPHNVMVNAKKLAAEHKSLTPPPAQFDFASDAFLTTAATSGSEVTTFDVGFPAGKPSWKWNASSGQWLRSQYGVKETDASDKSQLHATNVIVLKTKIDRSYKDFKYGYVPRTVVIGGGSGVVFSSGKAIAVTFKKAKQTDPISLFTKAGIKVELAPGNTWIELMSSDQALKINYKKAAPTPSPTK